MNTTKRYVKGNGKEFGKYGDIKISVLIDDLVKNANEKGYVNMILQKRKEVGKFGDTHSLVYDDWKPNKESASTSPDTPAGEKDDLPF